MSLYVLFDAVGATLRDIVSSPMHHIDNNGSYISIGNPTRWLIISLVNVFMVIVSFAILFLHYGVQFKPAITDASTAIYMSALTFTTLGYGDILPLCATGKILIVVELSFFLFFLSIKLPLSVSVIRTETRDRGGDAEGEESGTELALNETYDKVRNGARLILTYDAQSNSFNGTVENTTERTLGRVRVEVHLSNGKELGPTTPADLGPGEKRVVKLTATSKDFDGWSAHPEVGNEEQGGSEESGEHGGREGGGEHGREGSGEHK